MRILATDFFDINPELSVQVTASRLRLVSDYKEMANTKLTSSYCTTHVKKPLRIKGNDIITVTIQVHEGLYENLYFAFIIVVSGDYPFQPPRIISDYRSPHPNIDFDTGEVWLKVLAPKEWTPKYGLDYIIFALELILLEPDLEYIAPKLFNSQISELFLEHKPYNSSYDFQQQLQTILNDYKIPDGMRSPTNTAMCIESEGDADDLSTYLMANLEEFELSGAKRDRPSDDLLLIADFKRIKLN